MIDAAPWPLRFQVGARTIATVRRRLVRVPLDLADVLAGEVPVLPATPREAHGYLVTSLPAALIDQLKARAGKRRVFVRQRYTRYHIDLSIGFDGWQAQLSGNARSQLRRKAKKLDAQGDVTIREWRSADEMPAFQSVARGVAAKTYQERLLGAALPDTADFVTQMTRLAAADRVRAWTLHLDGEAIAYLYCPAHGRVLLYEHVGHDPAFGHWSPGTVLHYRALEMLFAERAFDWFDFTEGEGQHKAQLASGGTACVDLLLLDPTIANRATIAALSGFDRSVAIAKHAVQSAGLSRLARKLRRG